MERIKCKLQLGHSDFLKVLEVRLGVMLPVQTAGTGTGGCKQSPANWSKTVSSSASSVIVCPGEYRSEQTLPVRIFQNPASAVGRVVFCSLQPSCSLSPLAGSRLSGSVLLSMNSSCSEHSSLPAVPQWLLDLPCCIRLSWSLASHVLFPLGLGWPVYPALGVSAARGQLDLSLCCSRGQVAAS